MQRPALEARTKGRDSSCGISPGFPGLSPTRREVIHALLTRPPLYSGRSPFSCDLHVLGTPPAFVLSQDQTLQLNVLVHEGPRVLEQPHPGTTLATHRSGTRPCAALAMSSLFRNSGCSRSRYPVVGKPTQGRQDLEDSHPIVRMQGPIPLTHHSVVKERDCSRRRVVSTRPRWDSGQPRSANAVPHGRTQGHPRRDGSTTPRRWTVVRDGEDTRIRPGMSRGKGGHASHHWGVSLASR